MDRSTDWPWSWEEEVEWKTDLEERDYEFLQELMENEVEDSTIDMRHRLESLPEEPSQDAGAEKYLVTT
jgi:hypothetical protein